ncbi:snoRNA-binding rRNA-processing protein UTP6 ASCRUDRAFT_74938 [Ascoidea rubescens DSM 1968]|uniref:U3 small nucleolar RNA-associated protein 6 N-terminal domain-containing protein n=1 Tax=Ascoidea rubescens DSM 1968 TaxID=1344418 RepID=A0A1D2VLU4_9ASCO|nr:hypothetical protein ASCRUDRAFT_74938 [Ascoidea rubescens DSM 1968]ODV62583.1 hypothetical protein ASCRUDRAFT_74938 [Ascoidea rubescens DSM 1968]
MSDKARYYLEKSLPEIKDLQEKGLFTKNEIRMILQKKTTFEYSVASNPKVLHFLRYIEFENNLEKLRLKRYKRLYKVGLINTQKKSISDFSGQRRITFLYQRATQAFPNDFNLWKSYLLYLKKVGSIKLIYKTYSKLLQLHPTNIDTWISAANYEFNVNSNIKSSRALLQKGLRFNPDSLKLYLTYANLELNYISKLLARRNLLGLKSEIQQKNDEILQNDKLQRKIKHSLNNDLIGDKSNNENELNNDFTSINLPENIELENEQINKELNNLPDVEINMLGDPENNPALKGDISLIIFDSAISSILKAKNIQSYAISNPNLFKKNESELIYSISNKFLKLFKSFQNLNRAYLSSHINQYLLNKFPNDIYPIHLDIISSIDFLIDVKKIKFKDIIENLQLSVNKFMAYKSRFISNKDDKSKLTDMFVDYIHRNITNNKNFNLNQQDKNILQLIIKKCQINY